MGWLSSLGSKVAGGVKWLGSKVTNVANSVGSKMAKYGDIVAHGAEKVAPLLTVINPELGAAAATVAGVAKGASAVGKTLQASFPNPGGGS